MSTGQIHDLGYKHYVGTRRSVETRWRVIMRHQLSTAWRGWWRYKVWFIAALMATAIASVVLYLLSDSVFRVIAGMRGKTTFADGILPFSTVWYRIIGFVVSLTICATMVAGDIQSGAFTFYFARSVRPRDYVIGKLAGLAILMALIMAMGPLVFAGVRLGLSDNLDDLLAAASIAYKALAIGALGTLTYTAVPLGFSALVANWRYAIALWAAYYLLVGWMLQGIAVVTTPAIAALDLGVALQAVSYGLFDLHVIGRRSLNVPLDIALASILGHAVLAIGVVFWRVRQAQQTGVGGSS